MVLQLGNAMVSRTMSSRILSLSKAATLKQLSVQSVRTVSTSDKNKDAAAPSMTLKPLEPTEEPPKKYWVTYGFNDRDEYEDIRAKNSAMFFSITGMIVIFGWVCAYIPDVRFKNWSQREAHIELARREALGLPRIDANYANPENLTLPSDEELGDFEIII